jgi:hypothetical protein
MSLKRHTGVAAQVSLILGVLGCRPIMTLDSVGGSAGGSSGGAGSGSSGGSGGPTGDFPADRWFDVGWGTEAFTALESGDPFPIVLGGQGLLMWPVPLAGAGFHLPPDPSDWQHPEAPQVEIDVDVPGYDGPGGHLIHLANYPVPFTAAGDRWEFLYVTMILPDMTPQGVVVVPEELNGLPVHLEARLEPFGEEPLEVVYDLVAVAP